MSKKKKAGKKHLEAARLLEFMRYSYEQVLDATKHQDDKIGRLLTAIAFLTAAALALAGFSDGKLLSANIDLGSTLEPIEVPLGLVFLSCYLIGVVITVIQLLGSLSTPLMLPGLDGSKDTIKNAHPSTVYFLEIEKNSREEWKEVISADVASLEARQVDALRREVLNLAQRTSFKYNRSTEALAALTWSLICLALVVVCVVIAAMSNPPGEPITLGVPEGLFFGGILSLVVLVLSVSRYRYQRLGANADDVAVKHWAPALATILAGTGAVMCALGLAEWLGTFETTGFYVGSVQCLTAIAVGCVAVNALQRGNATAPESPCAGRSGWSVAAGGVFICLPVGLSLAAITVFAPSDSRWISLSAAALGFAVALGLALATGRPFPRLRLWNPRSVCDARIKVEGPQFPYNCPRCELARDQFKGRRAYLASLAAVAVGSAFAVISCRFAITQQFIWPLCACFGIVTLISISGALAPTFAVRRQRWHERTRQTHRTAASTPTCGLATEPATCAEGPPRGN